MNNFFPRIFMYLLSVLTLLIASSCRDNVVNTVIPEVSGFTKIGSYKTSGTANNVFVSSINGSNIAFVADGNSGLQILNVSNPSTPQFVSTFNTAGYTYDVKYAEINGIKYAFVADGINDFILLDVSNLYEPHQTGSIEFVDDAIISLAIDTINKKAFAGSYSGFLYIIDLNDLPNTLPVIGTYDAYDKIESIYVDGLKCYLAENNFGLEIINLSDYTFPVSLSYANTPGQSYDVFVKNGIAYVADGTAGISLFNIVSENNPVYIKSVKTIDVSTSLFFGQQRLFSTEGIYGIEGYNVSVPSSPSKFGSYQTAGTPFGGYFFNSNIFIADGNEGLVILNMTVK